MGAGPGVGPRPGVGVGITAAPASTTADVSLSGGRSFGGARVGAGVGSPRVALSLPAGGARVARLSLTLAVPSVAGGVPVVLSEPP